jgi:hypothetical protein
MRMLVPANKDPLALLYLILFDDPFGTTEQPPMVSTEEVRAGHTTFPHGFDLELVPILPAIDYCLQLPRTLGDTFYATASYLYKSRHLDLPHVILIAPVSLLADERLIAGLSTRLPTLILCSRESAPRGLALAERTKPPLGLATFDELSSELRARHWALLTELPANAADGSPYKRIEHPPPGLPTGLAAYNVLPSILDVHQLRLSDNIPFDELGDTRNAHLFRLHVRSRVYSIAEMKRRQLSESEAAEAFKEIFEQERAKIRLPMALGLPGVPRKYQHLAYGKKFKPSDSDLALERRVIRQCVTHRILATSGLGLMAEDAPDEVFQALASIEKHVVESPRTSPAPIWRQLGRISRYLQKAIGEEGLQMLHRAERVHAFTNFPVGLMTLPGHSSPLLCVAPVSIRPVLPLTRALQMEMTRFPYRYLKKQLRVLIAECLEPGDRIRGLSDVGWTLLKEKIEQIPGAVCVLRDFRDPESLARELEENDYDVLIISAHGVYAPGKSAAGLKFSTGVSLGLELGHVPPLVILSACHSSPRGVAAVNIGDLMLRQGAFAVLGTLVPVDVRRNAMLMVRLFANIAETIRGNMPLRTFEDVWSHVVAGNAVNEIMSTTAGLLDVLTEGSFDNSVLVEFMMRRSRGRLRLGHIYKDTEEILLEIARERGFSHQLRSVVESKNYFPESLFYTMIGRPDRIVISDALTDEMMSAQELDSSGARNNQGS